MAYFKNEFRSVLYVDDFEASTKFYGEGLELRSNYSWDDGPDDRGVKYLAAGGVIEVIRRDPPIAQGSTTLMLEAEDVNACYQAMKKKDWLIFLEDLADRPYGIRCFRLLDPNKNDIVIFSYLKDLGIGAIYLNPVFRARSNHKYDVGDYLEIDPSFGTEADFERLTREAADAGIHVVLDGVFSHMGSRSPYFQSASASPDSPYHDWYYFRHFPEE